MIGRLADLVVSTTFAGSLLLANTSCATRHPADAAAIAPRLEVQVHGARRLVQFSFGAQAAFGICVEPACPAATPKTLATAGAAHMQAVALRVVPSADVQQASGTQKALTAMPSPPQPAPPVPVDAAVRNVAVVFPFASAQLTAPARLALFASIGHARQSERIVIAGRTDAMGNDQVNESLALARAMSVRNYLRDQAPDLAAVISIDAKGRCCFVASNDTEEGRSRNRRVEVAFFSHGGG